MRSFVIGKVLEPEVRRTAKGKRLVEFGLLVGRSSEVVSVWEDDTCFSFACGLREGDVVIAIINPAVDNRGQIKNYVNNLASAPEGLREQLMSLFAPPESARIPEPQQKKVGA